MYPTIGLHAFSQKTLSFVQSLKTLSLLW